MTRKSLEMILRPWLSMAVVSSHPPPPLLFPSNSSGVRRRLRNAEHETEISFFNMADYLEFKADPTEKW